MGLGNHDRLDKILHTEEYLGMVCGSLGYIIADGTGQRVRLETEADGQLRTEKKYCSPNCPTLIEEHRKDA